MRALSPKVLKEIRAFIAETTCLRPSAQERQDRLLEAIDHVLKPKRSAAPAKARRTAKKATRRAKAASVREAVMERAGGACEACGSDIMPLDWDHFRAGAHKRSNETLEGTWALCRPCHAEKTLNTPSRLHWLSAFREHCLKHGYTREARDTEALIDALYLSAASQGGG